MRRPWPLAAIALLAVVAFPGLAASRWPLALLVAFLVPLAVARLWPGRMLACFLAGAPLAMAGGSAMGQPWLEAATLGTAAGLLAGQIPPAGSGKPASPSGPFPAAWTYLAISSCSFLAALIRLALEWRGQFPAFLAQAFWSLPVMEQSSSEHVLRAGLVLSGGVLWFLLLRRSLRRPGEIRLAWLGWLAGSLPVAAWGFWQWGRAEAWTGAAVTSLMEDRNVLGSYLVLTMFLAASMIRHQRVLVRRIAGAATLLLAGLLFLSGSKIALLAALGGAAVAALPLMRRRPRAAVLIGLLGVGAALGLFLAAPALLSTATVVQPGGAAQQDTSASPDAAEPGASPPGNGEAGFTTLRQIGSPRFLLFYAGQFRLQVWSAALAAAWERPFLGVGPGLLFRQLGNHYWLSGSGWRPGRENAHNQYLQLAAEIGPAGLLAFLWLLGGVLRPALSPATAAAVRLRGLGLLAYLVTGLTGHPLVLVSQSILFWSALALLATDCAGLETAPSRFSKWAVGLGPLLLVPALLLRPLALPCAASTDEGTGRAAAVMVDFDEGFYLEEVTPHSSRRWMEGPGQIRLCETGSSGGLWDLELNLASFAVPRNLLVRAGGVPILKTEIAPWTTPVKLQNLDLGHGPLSLTFSVQPGPQRVDPILHNGDRRPVSLQFMGSPVLAKEHPAPEPSASPETDGGPGEPP